MTRSWTRDSGRFTSAASLCWLTEAATQRGSDQTHTHAHRYPDAGRPDHDGQAPLPADSLSGIEAALRQGCTYISTLSTSSQALAGGMGFLGAAQEKPTRSVRAGHETPWPYTIHLLRATRSKRHHVFCSLGLHSEPDISAPIASVARPRSGIVLPEWAHRFGQGLQPPDTADSSTTKRIGFGTAFDCWASNSCCSSCL
jgi:hypothetical protein